MTKKQEYTIKISDEKYKNKLMEENRKKGREEGREEVIHRLLKIMTPEEITQKLEYPPETIKQTYENYKTLQKQEKMTKEYTIKISDETYKRKIKEEAFKEGYEEGMQIERKDAIKRLLKIMTLEEIAQILEYPPETINQLKE